MNKYKSTPFSDKLQKKDTITMNVDPSVKQHLFEVLEDVGKAKNKEEAATILRKHKSLALLDVLKGAYDPKVKFLVDHKVRYVPAAPESVPSTLLRNTDKFKYLVYFYKGGNKQYNSMDQKKREDIFAGLLESVHPKDAKILLDVVQKKIDYKNVNSGATKLAFPDLWTEEA